MSDAEKRFWNLLGQLASEGLLTGNAAERIGIAFDFALMAAENKTTAAPRGETITNGADPVIAGR